MHIREILNNLASGYDVPLPPTSLAQREGYNQDRGGAYDEQDRSSGSSFGYLAQPLEPQSEMSQSPPETGQHDRENNNSPLPFSAAILADRPPIPMAAVFLGLNEQEWTQGSIDLVLPVELHEMASTRLGGRKAKIRSWDGQEYDSTES